MPLDQAVTFKTPLRKSSRISVPRVIRGQFKLEPTLILKVTITLADTLGNKDSFFGKMRKDGYITVPPVSISMIKEDRQTLENRIIEVIIEPA
jgi:hypothetical protein